MKNFVGKSLFSSKCLKKLVKPLMTRLSIILQFSRQIFVYFEFQMIKCLLYSKMNALHRKIIHSVSLFSVYFKSKVSEVAECTSQFITQPHEKRQKVEGSRLTQSQIKSHLHSDKHYQTQWNDLPGLLSVLNLDKNVIFDEKINSSQNFVYT